LCPGIVGVKDCSWILFEGGHHEHTLSSLREAKGSRVDDAVSPLITQFLERSDDDLERLAFGQLEHERNVLEKEKGRSPAPKQSEDFGDEARSGAVNPSGHSGLAQILAGEPRRDDVRISRQRLQSPDILRLILNVRESRR
jgi:hypothetical protein